MISLETAREAIFKAVTPVSTTEIVPLTQAVGRVAAADLDSPSDLPAFDNAAVDGYAVHSPDLACADSSNPVRLEMIATVAAGEMPSGVVVPGSCARVFTGAVLPAGADAVVMQEDVSVTDGAVVFGERITAWEGIRLAGEDIRRGTGVVATGDRLKPAHLGLLAATGRAQVQVYRQVRIALLATGNELLDPGDPPVPGKIYDSNRSLLGALATADGISIVSAKRVPDTLEGTMAALLAAARSSDVVVTTGGVSVGDLDLVRTAMSALGGTVEMWRLAMKPGKPFAWGRLEGAHWFGLPGNPVSAFVTWWVLVRPALRRMMGMREPGGRRTQGRLAESVSNSSQRRHFLRVRLDEDGLVRPVGTQASHIQSTLVTANALLDTPPDAQWETGRQVTVELLE